MSAIAEQFSVRPGVRVPTLAEIQALEVVMRDHPNQVAIKTTHHFTEGIYAREIFIPAGVLLTGKMHRTAHLNIVSRGAIEVWTEEGMRLIRAPFAFVAPPGTKRVGLAHEDTVWTTVHPNPTGEQNLEQLEALLIIPENHLTGGSPCPGLQ
jgi:hypothetical protein